MRPAPLAASRLETVRPPHNSHFPSLLPPSGGRYVAVVYDVASRESFDSAGKWLHAVRSSRPGGGRPVPGVLIANKADLRQVPAGASAGTAPRAVITTKEGEAFAAANNLAFFEVSAATGADVDEPFNFIANQVHQKYEATVQSAELLASTTIPTEAGHP